MKPKKLLMSLSLGLSLFVILGLLSSQNSRPLLEAKAAGLLGISSPPSCLMENCQSFDAAIDSASSLALPLEQTPVLTTLTAVRDNTLYEDPTGSISNGSGQHFFVGRNQQASNFRRRGVIAFDVAGSDIPPGSTIVSAVLSLNMSRTIVSTRTIELHRLSANWGEGASDSTSNNDAEGQGASAALNDATWLHTFFNSSFWSTAGGDFSGTASASTPVNAEGIYEWGSTSQMVADVQDWLDNPGNNFGWLLLGDENQLSAKRFDSKDNPITGNRPQLMIEYLPPVQTPDLTLTKTVNDPFPLAGDIITYTIIIDNDGLADATDALISDTIPADLTFAGPVMLDPPGTTLPAPGFPTLASGLTITAGSTITLTFPVTVEANLLPGTQITNTATVTSAEIDTPVGDSVIIEIANPNPSLTLNKLVSNATPLAGDLITYTIVVANNGLEDATNARISDTLSSGLTFVGPVIHEPSGATLPSPTLPTLASSLTITAESSITLTFPVAVDSSLTVGTHITNTASVTSTEVVTPAVDDVVATVTTASVNFNVTKSVSNLSPKAGDLITYTVIAVNNGLLDATNVQVLDTLPAQVSFVGPVILDPPGTSLPGPTLPVLASGLTITSGDRITLTFPVSINEGLAAGTTIVNTASVTSAEVATPTLGTVIATIGNPNEVYLPLVLKDFSYAPDLIGSFTLTPNQNSFSAAEPVQITVAITNQGLAPTDSFWVDFFINPNPPPTAANTIWNNVCSLTPCYGLAWFVSNGLGPGESITLTSVSGSFAAPQSNWPGHFANGTSDLYLFVDSWNPGVATGGVAESNEANNRAERHGLTVSGLNPFTADEPAVKDLPPRPRKLGP
jgi:uncharacterized repeat protein (TIGR01451 family)